APAAAAALRSRPSRGLGAFVPPSVPGDVFGLGHELPDAAGRRVKGAALRVGVLNGDLKFIRQPLLIGHYRALLLTGTEDVVDGLVAQAMSRSLATGLYPDAPGSHQIFDNRREDPDNVFDLARPSAAIVAGLGEEGKLRAVDLVYTVRQAVLAYAQRVAEQGGGGVVEFEMAAALIGSGGTGISAGTAAQLIAQGALEANAKLQESAWPQLGQLTFVELFLERAADAWRALQLLETTSPNRVRVLGKVQHGAGALRRSLDSSYRGAAYDFISALTVDLSAAPAQRCISYTLDTRRARTEVRAQRAQGSLLKELVLKASNDANRDPLIGRTLFNLLVPVEMEPFLGGTSEMLIELDAGTAVIPWELLDTNPDPQSGDQRPWAIRSKLLRKLRVENFRDHARDASTDDCVLVIGEPASDPAIYPPLPGARAEAIAVARRLALPDVGLAAERVRLLANGDDAQTIINALFERAYRVIHIAGHGAPRADGGVVLSGADTFLGANEVRAMRVVPELVFLNCCHLAGRDAQSVLAATPYDRAVFAANIAEELIRVGVRCVIAAGWAVEDGPAEQFATTFYGALLGGARFIEAVAAARNAAWKASPQGNTWAAYQCYGDPDWHWQRQVGDAQRPVVPAGEQFAGIASPVTLTLALENIAIAARYSKPRPGTQPTAQLDKVRYLESEFAPLWGAMGAVAEAFGVAYTATGDADKAIEWYTKALGAEDASASFKAAEALANQLVRRGEKADDAQQAHADVTAGIRQLESLAALRPTIERAALLGSAYKRLTMIEFEAHRNAPAEQALASAIGHYAAAAAEARREAASHLFFYPAKNAISCEMRAALLAQRVPAIAAPRFQEVRESLRQTAEAEPDFWSAVGQIELRVLEAECAGGLAAEVAAIVEKLRDLKARVPATSMWDSVHTEARFTLEPYRALVKAGSPEHRAAGSLLAELKAMAGG
ncbi:MAG TPA: CHAT domain-containing protein, partial [Burkholderiaceae bacterium]|nr:CHAT domain-containing protein [Burkholderiaceae bacterium]